MAASDRPEAPIRVLLAKPGLERIVNAAAAIAMAETFGSSCHGAGRRLSRSKAKKVAAGRPIFKELKARGIYVRSDSRARDLLYEYDALRRYGDAQVKDTGARDPHAL